MMPVAMLLHRAGAETRDLALLKLLSVTELENHTHHVQGIVVVGGSLWVSSVFTEGREGYLHEFDLSSGRHRATIPVHDGERFHVGGIDFDGDSIWVPAAEYRKQSASTILTLDPRNREVTKRFEVADHIGCLAVVGDRVLGGNWDSKEIYSWNQATGEILRKQQNPNQVAYQDLKYTGGALVGSGVLSRETGAIDRLDPDTLAWKTRIVCGKTDRGVRFTNEGMAIHEGRLFLLPEDGPSRLFTFQL
ncbi:MAG: DUF6454 family protein [Bryobacterales bacterium]|nr:DUF6454 family protein [Bryobacterales bacterium]